MGICGIQIIVTKLTIHIIFQSVDIRNNPKYVHSDMTNIRLDKNARGV